ncbi:MAG TPA: ABC transporter permease subunit [Aggregatilineales bacterium]|nr:ABC transporter permease subunit [Aggregatilineales bacterium]
MVEPSSQNNIAPVDLAERKGPPKSLWRETLENMLRNPSAIVGMILLGLLALIAVFAPLIATHNPELVLFDVPEEGAAPRLKPCIHFLGCPEAGGNLLQTSVSGSIQNANLNKSDTLALAAYGNDIKIWSLKDTEGNRDLGILHHDNPVNAAAWSANEQFILSSSGDELLFWDINKNNIVRTLPNPENTEYIEWNADGLRFFTGDSHRLTFWDGTLYSRVGSPIQFEDEIVTAQWNDNGTVVMTASGNKVQLWNAFTATEIKALEYNEPITGANYNSTSTRILTTSGNTIRVWDSASYEELNVIEYDVPLANATWNDNASKRIRRVVASSEDKALIWNLETGELILELDHGEPIIEISSSPLATRIYTTGEQKLRVWDIPSGEEIAAIDLAAPISSIEWMTDGAGVMFSSGENLRLVKTSNFQYLLGTDGNARDEFSRLVYGTRISLYIGFVTVTFAIISGTFLGSVAGYLGGWADNIIMRFLDVLLAFPALILAIAIITVLGPGLINALIALAIVTIPQYARVARAGVLSVKEQDFVTADRALGVSSARILFRRILPNILAPLIVQGTLGIGGAILEAAALSFIGLGAQPPTPEWGAMLAAERNQLFTAPHLVFIPGIAIMIVVLSFNLLGDGLRDSLDPRLNR